MSETLGAEPIEVRAEAGGDESQFLARVGGRVRMARARKGISRRALSERSGVSQRHLAKLESGAGNISIALLKRIADALAYRIEWLIGEDDPSTSPVIAAMSLFRAAADDTRRKVFEILDPGFGGAARAQRIALIGLRGAGKSTLGLRCAAALALPFVELNREIQRASGMPVNEIIALFGQEGYRRLERQALERVATSHDRLVLAVAGGIVSEPDTFGALLRRFHTVWLKATPEEHMARVRAQGDMRPMAGIPAAMDELRSILTSREALYARSEAEVDTSGRDVEESLADLLAVIAERRFLAP
jgi:XRE family aerobic/anaerobic benzoate catabolism transcriptional regulator